MSHSEVLQQLFPLELGGDFAADLAVEGNSLDTAAARAEALLLEAYPDTTSELVNCWERVCNLTPGPSDSLQLRRDRIIAKLRELGGLSRAYFIGIAAAMGYDITIEEQIEGESIFAWRVTMANQPIYYFRAGESAAGDRLMWWDVHTALEGLLTELKPAHTRIIFAYA